MQANYHANALSFALDYAAVAALAYHPLQQIKRHCRLTKDAHKLRACRGTALSDL